jgi:hypothetical protein
MWQAAAFVTGDFFTIDLRCTQRVVAEHLVWFVEIDKNVDLG